ncbi:MAG: WD40 repeat domain-containing protein [Xanthomonadaceae bacterium]|nr:WD40 repeat domain-containing protein [Xanthomonadaceae bacterium]
MTHSENPHSLRAQLLGALSAEAVAHDPERGILLGMQALDATLRHGEPAEFAADRALRQAIWRSRLRLALRYDTEHTTPTCAAWNNDGTRLATGSDNGPTTVWDASTGERIWSNDRFTNALTIAFSPDGSRVAVGGLLPNVAILNASDGAVLKTISVKMAVSLAFSPDGRRLAIQTSDSSGVWDIETAALSLTLAESAWANIAWSPDGKRIATCANGVRVWDADTGHALQTFGPARTVRCATWSPDSRLLAVALEHACEIWDTATGAQGASVGEFAVGGGIVAWSPDGARLAKRGGSGNVAVYDASDGRLSLTLEGHRSTDPGPFLAWSPDGFRLATGAGLTGSLKYSAVRIDRIAEKRGHTSVKIWDVRVDDALDGQEVSTLRSPARIYDAAWCPDGERIAVACEDASRIIDAATGKELWRFPPNARIQHADIAWSPDGAWCVATEYAYGSAEQSTRIWFAANGEELLTLPATDAVAVGSLRNMSWSADGARLAALYANGNVGVWDMPARRNALNPLAEIRASTLALSLDGKRLATASGNAAAIRIWDVESGQLSKMLGSTDPFDDASGRERYMSAPNGIAWLSDSERLVAITGASVVVWCVSEATALFEFPNPIGYLNFVLSADRKRLALLAKSGTKMLFGPLGKSGDSPLLSLWDLENGRPLPPPEFLDYYGDLYLPVVAWSPDGQRITMAWPARIGLYDGDDMPDWGGIERFVRVCDATSGEEIFAVNHMPADGVTWRPDGKRIACFYGKRLQIYASDPQSLLALARTRVTRNFTVDECVQYFHGDDPPPIP